MSNKMERLTQELGRARVYLRGALDELGEARERLREAQEKHGGAIAWVRVCVRRLANQKKQEENEGEEF